MSVQAQYNPLMFYPEKSYRQWDITENQKFILTYPIIDGNSSIPAFNLIIDSLPEDPAPTVLIKLYNCLDEEITIVGDIAVSNKRVYTQIFYQGELKVLEIEGYYYLKVTINLVDYFSDMFRLSDDLDNLLKIECESTKIRLGEFEYELAFTNYTFYVENKFVEIKNYISETATENYSITNTLYGSSAIIRTLTILGSESIFLFLRGLRILRSNGSVYITWNNIRYLADEISVEVNQNNGKPDLFDIKLEFKVKNETVSMIN